MKQELSQEQDNAIKEEGLRILVLAGAGAGKTRTILEKIIYLIQEKQVKPYEIMAITFTKNAANEMIDRLLIGADSSGDYQSFIEAEKTTAADIKLRRLQEKKKHKWINQLTIRTFHSLCYTILRNYGAKEFDNKFKLLADTSAQAEAQFRNISADESQYEILHRLLIDQCKDRSFLLHFKRFILDYMVDRIHVPHKANLEQFPNGKYYTSLRGEKVRSKSEQYICDWLYRHSIDYQYEQELHIDNVTFRPDFFIPQANLFIEHVSKLSASMDGKERLFVKGGRTFAKTFEFMMRDSNIINNALSKIVKKRLPSNFEEIVALNYEEEMKGRHAEVRNFLRQVIRVLEICQSDRINIAELKSALKSEPHERIRMFYDCCLPLVSTYYDYCTNKSYLDFNQLMDRATLLLRNHEDVAQKMHQQYKYVLVDEFQDVNQIQIEFIKVMMNPAAQLFCVGDDWQSIYGFRGSDIKYIVEFKRFFKDGKVFALSTNYRSNDQIVGASNQVISNNIYQSKKKIKAFSKSNRKIQVYAGTDLQDTVFYMIQEIKALLEKGLLGDDILILYRRSKMFAPYKTALSKENIKVNARTIHASKGLESKVVFIIGLTEGYGGFPDIWMGDRIYQVVRPVKYDILMEEERRLFYVALTRAKEHLYLITELGVESSFIDEIPLQFKVYYSSNLAVAQQDTIKCGSCHFKLDALFRFCPNCGEEQSS